MPRALTIALALTLSAPELAHAQVPQVAIARQLAIQGIDAVESGDCKKGLPLLQRAEQMHHAAVHLQYLARCRAKNGHLVAATEMWRQIIREGAPAGASPAIVAAIQEAATSLERTMPRLASTTIKTAGDYPGLTLVLDGTSIPPEVVGTAQAVDPGDHELVADAKGFAKHTERWTVTEGGSAEVLITLSPVAETSGAAPDGGAGGGTSPKPFPLATAGWITASAGVAALVGGTVTWLSRNNRRRDLESACPDQTCPPTRYDAAKLEDEKSSIRTLTTATNVLMIGGGVLLAGGVTLIVVGHPSTQTPASAALLAGGPLGTPGLRFAGHW